VRGRAWDNRSCNLLDTRSWKRAQLVCRYTSDSQGRILLDRWLRVIRDTRDRGILICRGKSDTSWNGRRLHSDEDVLRERSLTSHIGMFRPDLGGLGINHDMRCFQQIIPINCRYFRIHVEKWMYNL